MDRFYHIQKISDDACNITIYVESADTEREKIISEYTLYAIPYYPDIELNVREHYESWKAHAIAFTTQCEVILCAVGVAGRNAYPWVEKPND